MSIRPFELIFNPPQCSPLLQSARAHIAVSTLATENGHTVLSSECRTLQEVEEEINRLKKDLDRIQLVAKKKFAKYPREVINT